ncbi:MAG: hypothetical protein HXS48_23090 [Theionarchaea archaeon]|nr:hypothetical protein [Theionarchaea archaeon]
MKDRFTPGIEEVLDLLGNYGTPEVLEYINDYPQCTKGELETLVENTTVTTLMGRLQQKELVTEELKLTDEGPQKRSGKHDTGTVIFLKVDSRRLSTLQGMKPP